MKFVFRKYAGALCGIVALLFFATPLFIVKQASAFSLGQIRVTGAPNKKLRVEIPVRIDGRPGLKVSLGDAADYKRLGVPRPVFLDGLMLEVAPHPITEDQSIIYITSSKPVLAPSFNLVVKAHLGGGTILKNYFLALDFQKNLNLDLPVTAEERVAMEKIAKEIRNLKPGEKNKEPETAKPKPVETDSAAMIEKIKKEEKTAQMAEGWIESEPITKPGPADQVRPVKVSPPKPAIRKVAPEPKPAKTDSAAMIEKIKKEEIAAQLAKSRIQPKTVTKPEQSKAIVKPSSGRPPIMQGQVVGISADPLSNFYKVKKGDTLYKIARKLGVSRKEYDRVVVALWRDNSRHFIKGNIHGLYEGGKLDFSRINETVLHISRADAKKIIMEQWPLWQNRGVTASSKTMAKHATLSKPLIGIKAPAVKLPFKSEILSALAGWRDSFVAGDTADYMGYYSDNFKDGEVIKQNLDGVKFDNVKMTENDGVIEVILPAPAGSDKKKAHTPGKLYFAIENGRYKIVKETEGGEAVGATDEIKGNHPFIVHIASFKNQEPAQKLVELLRKKGYNAFEVLSFVPGKGSWHRVAVDRFASVSEADKFSSAIKKSGLSRYARTLRLPYAIRIGDIVSPDKTEAKIKEYLNRGFSTYAVKEGSGGKASIFLGAFDSERSATRALALLGELKNLSSVIRP